jgi:hypothetical protein
MLQSWERGTVVGGTDGAEIILMVDDRVLSRALFLVMVGRAAPVPAMGEAQTFLAI